MHEWIGGILTVFFIQRVVNILHESNNIETNNINNINRVQKIAHFLSKFSFYDIEYTHREKERNFLSPPKKFVVSHHRHIKKAEEAAADAFVVVL